MNKSIQVNENYIDLLQINKANTNEHIHTRVYYKGMHISKLGQNAPWSWLFIKKDGKLLPLMLGWFRLPLRKKESKLWKAVPLCMLWTIWKERNRIVFEDECFSRTRLKSCFLRSISSWASLIQDVEHSFVRGILCIP